MCNYDIGSDDWVDEQDGSDAFLSSEYESYEDDSDVNTDNK